MSAISRQTDQPRPLEFRLHPAPYAEGSCLISTGSTRVLCTASVQEDRRVRHAPPSHPHPYVQRAYRCEGANPGDSAVDRPVPSCGHGHGGTGGSVRRGRLRRPPGRRRYPDRGHHRRLLGPLARRGRPCARWAVGPATLDLDYDLDFRADVDMNVVATEDGGIVEVQGTAEGAPFSRASLDELVDLALSGIQVLLAGQREALRSGQVAQ